ncbi:MAG: isoprenyl transferase [Candidatus Gastranaerophilales bacterium]|nr:isoprenyl transferase [Candidatus Gastranaerophilales bacterium]
METITKSLEDEMIEVVKNTSLSHIAIIMDGNRRWAKQKFLPSAAGHSAGVTSLKRTVTFAQDIGIKVLTVYAFSTENWQRKQEEVDFLMKLLASTIEHELSELYEKNVKMKFIGDLTRFSPELRKVLDNAEQETSNNTGLLLQIAINYGARDELKNAVKQIAKEVKEGSLAPENITEDTITERLYTKNVQDPDLLIRTGGEMRISNYLLWQIAYSELYVTDTFWPDFDKNDLALAINSFAQRDRRFGKK